MDFSNYGFSPEEICKAGQFIGKCEDASTGKRFRPWDHPRRLRNMIADADERRIAAQAKIDAYEAERRDEGTTEEVVRAPTTWWSKNVRFWCRSD